MLVGIYQVRVFLSEGDDTFQGVVLLHYKERSQDCYITCHNASHAPSLEEGSSNSVHVSGACAPPIRLHKRHHQLIKPHPHDVMD